MAQNVNTGRNDTALLEPEFKRIKVINKHYTSINSAGKKPVTPSIAEFQNKLSKIPSKMAYLQL